MSGRTTRWIAAVLGVALAAGGCIGPFNLTRRLYQWNVELGDKWEQEFMFIILAWAPVYGLAVTGDALVFNAMQFWTGRNPVDPPHAAAPSERRVVRGDGEAVITYTAGVEGGRLTIAQYQSGEPVSGLTIQQ